MDSKDKIVQNLDRFVCQRCNQCCLQPGFVYLREGEAEALAAHLTMDVYAFTDQYTDVLDRRQLVLKKKNGEACVFLTEQGCSVHAVKPRQCRDFPFSWRTEKSFDYCEGLKKLAGGGERLKDE